MRCKKCNSVMVETLSFSKEKRERFYKCSGCSFETEHKKLEDNYDFEDVFKEE